MPKDVNPRHGGKGGKEMGMCAPTRQLAWRLVVHGGGETADGGAQRGGQLLR